MGWPGNTRSSFAASSLRPVCTIHTRHEHAVRKRTGPIVHRATSLRKQRAGRQCRIMPPCSIAKHGARTSKSHVHMHTRKCKSTCCHRAAWRATHRPRHLSRGIVASLTWPVRDMSHVPPVNAADALSLLSVVSEQGEDRSPSIQHSRGESWWRRWPPVRVPPPSFHAHTRFRACAGATPAANNVSRLRRGRARLTRPAVSIAER